MESAALTARQVADELQVHRSLVDKWVRAGRLPGRKAGGSWWIRQEDVNQFLRARGQDPTTLAQPGPARPWCLVCKHWYRELAPEMRCDAFPEGIPVKILENRRDHRKFYPGDRGVRFEPVDGATVPQAEELLASRAR